MAAAVQSLRKAAPRQPMERALRDAEGVMTDTPRPGWWTCYLCSPPVHDRGGQAAFYAHWNRVHGSEAKR